MLNGNIIKKIVIGISALATAIIGGIAGKKASDQKYKPYHEQARQAAEKLNDLHCRKKRST